MIIIIPPGVKICCLRDPVRFPTHILQTLITTLQDSCDCTWVIGENQNRIFWTVNPLTQGLQSINGRCRIWTHIPRLGIFPWILFPCCYLSKGKKITRKSNKLLGNFTCTCLMQYIQGPTKGGGKCIYFLLNCYSSQGIYQAGLFCSTTEFSFCLIAIVLKEFIKQCCSVPPLRCKAKTWKGSSLQQRWVRWSL